MEKIHDVTEVTAADDYLYLTVDGRSYRILWADCSERLAAADPAERTYVDVAPSGYGLHWPLLDEDLAITPLLQRAEALAELSQRDV